MIRKIDWLLQSETGWQKFTQKTKRQPEKILSDFKRLQGTNAAALGKKPAGCFLPKCPKWFRHQELVSSQNSDILGICFCSKQVYIIPQDFRDFFVICPEKYWKMVPSVPFSIAPQEVFFSEASPKRTASVARDGLSGRPNQKQFDAWEGWWNQAGNKPFFGGFLQDVSENSGFSPPIIPFWYHPFWGCFPPIFGNIPKSWFDSNSPQGRGWGWGWHLLVESSQGFSGSEPAQQFLMVQPSCLGGSKSWWMGKISMEEWIGIHHCHHFVFTMLIF